MNHLFQLETANKQLMSRSDQNSTFFFLSKCKTVLYLKYLRHEAVVFLSHKNKPHLEDFAYWLKVRLQKQSVWGESRVLLLPVGRKEHDVSLFLFLSDRHRWGKRWNIALWWRQQERRFYKKTSLETFICGNCESLMSRSQQHTCK